MVENGKNNKRDNRRRDFKRYANNRNKIITNSAANIVVANQYNTAVNPKKLPTLPKGALRIVALGGISEVGRNMTVFEYEGKLLIVDCGVLFPKEEQPGVDLILPDFTYIEKRIKDVEAIVLTHGHEDHIGAVPFLLRLRPDIPVLGSKFTLALLEAKCKEHKQNPVFEVVHEGEVVRKGKFECEFFAVNHSIPDALAVAIKTRAGVVLHTGDIKLDQLPIDNRLTDLGGFARLGDDGVDLFMVDSTNAEVPGFVVSEVEIGKTLENIITNATNRVIVASFASHVHRIQQVVDVAYKNNRKIVFVGRSMVKNMKIAQDLDFLHVPNGMEVELEEALNLNPKQVLFVTTGSQGEPMAALSRMSRGEFESIRITPDDLIILASSLIPGNETSVFTVVNALSRIGAKVVTQQNARVHVSGHASSGELLYLYNAVRPSNVMPIHGEWRHIRANAALAKATGVPEDNVVLAENGVVVDLVDGKADMVGRVPVGHVYVDGLAVGDIGTSTLSDRLILGESGFISVTVAINATTGALVANPVVSEKGFSDDPSALNEVNKLIKKQLEQLENDKVTDTQKIAQAIRRTVGSWVSQKYRRKPMIIPNVVKVQ